MERLAIVLALASIHWFMLEARWARPQSKHGYTVYSLPLGLKLLLCTVIPVLLYGAFDNLRQANSERWVSVVLVALDIFIFAFIPPTILCSQQQLISIRWGGIKRVSMNWKDVVSMYVNPEDNSVRVIDKSDRSIVHTAYNVGRAQFLAQIAECAPPSIDRPSPSGDIYSRRSL